MSIHRHGLLLSQLLDCVSRPLEEEQVWALCFEICQSLLECSGRINQASHEIGRLSSTGGVTFAVETIYLGKDGRITFIPSHSSCAASNQSSESLTKQMKDLWRVLSACLENGGPNEFLKRQVGSDLESLMWNMTQRDFVNNCAGWIDIVADRCIRHASSQAAAVTISEYYRGICELLVEEAMEMNNFLAVVMNEIAQCESRQDAFSTFQLSQARHVISNWLQCMSEIREESTQKNRTEAFRSPMFVKSCNQSNPLLSSTVYVSPPGSKSFLPEIVEHVHSPEAGEDIPKPSYHSTPAVVCKNSRRVLRPPQRLVNQVTTWMLEDASKGNSSYDVSWLPGQQLSVVTSTLGWFREAKRMRHVLTELQLDTAMDDEPLYKALRAGEICFCCQSNKFSLFHRASVNCEVCERKICSSCIARVTSRELGVNSRDTSLCSRDSGMGSRDFENCTRDESDISNNSKLFGQIRKVFKPRADSGEKYCSLCKDCRDFIQRYF